jgi:hypothetical protein
MDYQAMRRWILAQDFGFGFGSPEKAQAFGFNESHPRVFDERLRLKKFITDSLPTLGIEEV